MQENSPVAGLRVILVAPNVSEQMGGEAIKALQIYQELERQGVEVHQITHDRVRREVEAKWPGMRVTYVKDTWLQKLWWKSRIFRPLVGLYFQKRAAKLARRIAGQAGGAVIHFTSPVSPVMPIFRTKGAPVVHGPINGNIYHPRGFGNRESLGDRIRRWGHPAAQALNRFFFPGNRAAEVLLVAGGERTYRSLRRAGCREEQFVDSIDSGVLNRLLEQPRITHQGKNLKFVHNGRLVGHKGADLAIKALAKTKHPVELEIIGRGPMRNKLEKLARKLGVIERVKFTAWIEDHSKVSEVMRQYRGFVFPSLAEANGIVVQEAMVMGLPVICVDWGGPSLLVDSRCGYPIRPVSEEYVVEEIARAMDELSQDGEKAEAMSKAGREMAVEKGFMWKDIARNWIGIYKRVTGNALEAIVARPKESRKSRVKISIERIGEVGGVLSDDDEVERPTVHY